MMLTGKNILITGISSGIGRSITEICIAENAHVWGIARNEERIEEVKKSCLFSDHLQTISYDLSIPDYNEDYLSTFLPERCDGFVHSAGISISKPLQFQEPEILFETFSINIISAMKLITLLTERFNYNASIVFISSVMGLVGQSAKLSYCASKGAITAFTRSLALEYTSRKIRVNSILPGVVKTPLFETLMDKLPSESLENIYTQHPLGLGEPADIAHLVLFLLSDMSKYINGSLIAVDGGYLAR